MSTAPTAPAGAPAADLPARFLDRPGGRLAYDDTGVPTSGAAPLVVAAPGMGDLRAQYRFLAPRLAAAGARVVTLDLRGSGGSSTGWPDYSAAAMGADLVALLRHLDAGPAVLVGNSFAAGAAAWAAAEAPEAVSGLALLGPFVRDIPLTPAQDAEMAGLGAALAGPRRVDAWVGYYRSLYPSAPPADLDAYTARLAANLAEPGRFDALLAMLTASKADVEARLGEVRAPALVVMGTRDPDFADPVGEAVLVAGRLRGEVLLVDGAGHYPHVEAPDMVAPRVAAFVRAATDRAAARGAGQAP